MAGDSELTTHWILTWTLFMNFWYNLYIKVMENPVLWWKFKVYLDVSNGDMHADDGDITYDAKTDYFSG